MDTRPEEPRMPIDYAQQAGMSEGDWTKFVAFAREAKREGYATAASGYSPDFESPHLQKSASTPTGLQYLYQAHLHLVDAWMDRMTALPYQRRAIEADGTVHAARYAGDRQHFTTACATYPAPAADRIEPSSATAVTCGGCLGKLQATR